MSRVAGIEPSRAGALLRFVYALVRKRLGKVPTPIKVTAHHSGVMRGTAMMEMAQEGAKSVPAPLKKLAQLAAAARVGCPF